MDKLSNLIAEPRANLQPPTAAASGGDVETGHALHDLISLLGQDIGAPTEELLGALEMLLATTLSDTQRIYRNKAHRSAQTLMTIVNNILDISKIEAGKIILEAIDFDLRTTVAEVAESFKNSGEPHEEEITFLVHHDVPAMVRGDPGRLRQILINFLPYALQFTGEKGISLRAQVTPGAEDEVMVRFEVTHNDQGFILLWPESMVETPKDMEHQPKPPATGLGFAISKRLTALMGGRFGVETKPDKRSVAWVSIRLKKTPDQISVVPLLRGDLRGLSVLAVVDEQATYQELLAQTLSWGMSCDTAHDGPQALEMLRASAARGQSYDLAILDVQIPGSDGLELARAIHKDPQLSAVCPVVLIAAGLRGHAEESRQAGVAGYLTKPVDQSELYNCLRAVMGAREANCALRPQPPAKLVTSHSLKEGNARHASRVLVAEDNKVNQMVIIRMLEKLGMQVDVASNGRAAAEACLRTSYDLVLMDCQMPEVDGFEATRLILDSESARGIVHVPIAAVTANAMQEDREKCLRGGMDDYIAKPFKLDQIRKLLERWIPAFSKSQSVPSAASNQESAVDTSTLQGLRVRQERDDSDFLAGLIATFLPEARARLAAINEAVARADAGVLMQAAHSLRGSSAVMGAKTMAALCADLEACARKSDLNNAAALASQLENEFGRARDELHAKMAA